MHALRHRSQHCVHLCAGMCASVRVIERATGSLEMLLNILLPTHVHKTYMHVHDIDVHMQMCAQEGVCVTTNKKSVHKKVRM